MRCPKCRYISFGTTDRCRNCGYDFSLVEEIAPPDLPIQANADVGPLSDLPLGVAEGTDGRAASQPGRPGDLGRSTRRLATVPRTDLPLFQGGHVADDAPLVVPPATPRPPLAVRKPGPTSARSWTDPPAAERSDGDQAAERAVQRPDDPRTEGRVEAEAAAGAERAAAASVPRRALAGLVDVAILTSIDGGVVYLTLRVLGLSTDQLGALPAAPLVAFLLLLNGGYLAIFTAAGGQTIGKMCARIRVVPSSFVRGPGVHVPLGTAVVRAATYFVSVLPLGLGLVPILFTGDRRALHDRLADTRVVRA